MKKLTKNAVNIAIKFLRASTEEVRTVKVGDYSLTMESNPVLDKSGHYLGLHVLTDDGIEIGKTDSQQSLKDMTSGVLGLIARWKDTQKEYARSWKPKFVFDENGIHCETGTRYDEDGYNWTGFDKNGINKETGTKYDKEGYDVHGYDKDGFDEYGYDRNGYDEYGFDEHGYDKDGYNKDGYDWCGYNEEGFDRNGFDRKGIHRVTGTRYDENGFNWYGWNREGINKWTGTKYDRTGHDMGGYNRDGIHEATGTKYDEYGFDREGLHIATGTNYDEYGYDRDGWSEDGYNKETGRKYNRDGFAKDGSKPLKNYIAVAIRNDETINERLGSFEVSELLAAFENSEPNEKGVYHVKFSSSGRKIQGTYTLENYVVEIGKLETTIKPIKHRFNMFG